MERIAQRVWAEERSNVLLDWFVFATGVVLLTAAIAGAATFDRGDRIAEGAAPGAQVPLEPAFRSDA